MKTISKPASLDMNQFSAAVRHISAQAVKRVEGRPNFMALWDDSISPAPTVAELESAAEKAALESADRQAREQAERVAVELSVKQMVHGTLEEADKRSVIGMYPRWGEGEDVVIGVMRRHKGALYECVQDHTTQADWQPPDVPALWKEVVPPGTVGAWSQPAGAHDAYPLGAKVTHNGQTWQSTIADNVWEPGVHGWETVN